MRSLQESSSDSCIALLKEEIGTKDELIRSKEEELGQRMAALKQLDNCLGKKR